MELGGGDEWLQSLQQASPLREGTGYNTPYQGGELPSQWHGPQFRNLYEVKAFGLWVEKGFREDVGIVLGPQAGEESLGMVSASR